METLLPLLSLDDVPEQYHDSPISRLIEYHNFDRPFERYETAEMLIGMCMDNRKHMHIPDNFAFIIRTGGANLRYSEFKVSYAISVGGARAIALIGHTQCGMVNLVQRRELFVQGMVNFAGWTRDEAEHHFESNAHLFEIVNEAEFVRSEVIRLRKRYPKILIAPMIYKVEDNLLYLIKED